MRIRIYTDGACSDNPGPGGWAVAINTAGGCIQYTGCSYDTTNNRMELTAMLRALQYVAEDGNTEDVYEIYCDSAYVVNAISRHWLSAWKLNNWKTKTGDDVKNKDLWAAISDYLRTIHRLDYQVGIRKVKGHAGDPMNELVDRLAKAETEKAKVGVGNGDNH